MWSTKPAFSEDGHSFQWDSASRSRGSLEDGAISYRSMGAINQPNYQGNISPTSQGRSVREFEEQMAALRKDNFNLKLKLYFIEETVPGFQQAMNNGQDVALKQLIDKKVENEMLRKEVKEKQDLLKDAVQAMNHLESMLKEKDEKHQMAIEELNHKINFYEMERELQQHSNSLLEVGNSKAESDGALEEEMNDLKNKLQQGEERIQDLEKQINQLDSILIQRDETIKNLEDKVSELKVQNDNLSSSLRQKSEDLKTSERTIKTMFQDMREMGKERRNITNSYELVRSRFSHGVFLMTRAEMEKELQEKQLTRLQALINDNVSFTKRLLLRVAEYDKLIKAATSETLSKNENRFFRVIMRKFDKGAEYFAFLNSNYGRKNVATSTDDLPKKVSNKAPSTKVVVKTEIKRKISTGDSRYVNQAQYPTRSRGHHHYTDYKVKHKFIMNLKSYAASAKQNTKDARARQQSRYDQDSLNGIHPISDDIVQYTQDIEDVYDFADDSSIKTKSSKQSDYDCTYCQSCERFSICAVDSLTRSRRIINTNFIDLLHDRRSRVPVKYNSASLYGYFKRQKQLGHYVEKDKTPHVSRPIGYTPVKIEEICKYDI